MMMDLDERLNGFLGSGEKVISSFQGFFVTNWRLIFIIQTEDGRNRTFQDFDYKHISHIHCESTVGSDSRFLGICAIILGLLLIAVGYYTYWGGTALILGVLILIAGILLALSKPEQKSILKIDVVGISNPIIFALTASASQMDRILRPLAWMREITTLRHDPITLEDVTE